MTINPSILVGFSRFAGVTRAATPLCWAEGKSSIKLPKTPNSSICWRLHSFHEFRRCHQWTWRLSGPAVSGATGYKYVSGLVITCTQSSLQTIAIVSLFNKQKFLFQILEKYLKYAKYTICHPAIPECIWHSPRRRESQQDLH